MRRTALGRFSVVSLFALSVFFTGAAANAQCPFAVGGGTSAFSARDGLLLIRAAQNFDANTITLGAGSIRTGQQVLDYVSANNARLDVTGSGSFDDIDAAIIARHLSGFRDENLIASPLGAGAGATRTTGTAIQNYIEGGCIPPIPANRVGRMSYFFNNDMFEVNMVAGTSQLRLTDNDFLLKYVGHAIGPNGEIVVGYNVDNLGNNSQIHIYRANGTLENAFGYSLRLASAPKFSPDAQVIGFNVEIQSGQLGVPSSFSTGFINRGDGTQVSAFNGAFVFGWMPDGRPVFKGTSGLNIFPSLTNVAAGILIPNTQNAGPFSVSPAGDRLAFIARPSAQAPSHVYMIDVAGTNLRQVTTSRIGEEVQALFSPSGHELLIRSDACGGSVFIDAGLIQIIPANATLLDVTASDATYALRIDNRIRTCTSAPFSWR